MRTPDGTLEAFEALPLADATLFDSIGDGIGITDAAGKLLFCNAALAELLDRSAAELIGQSLFGLFDPGAETELRHLHAAVIAAQSVRRASVYGRGGGFCARVVMRPLAAPARRDAPSRPAGRAKAGRVAWCFADITHAVHGSSFQPAMYSAEIGFWQIDVAADEVHWWNDWCAGFDLDPCLGPHHVAQWNATIHPDDLPYTSSYEDTIEGRADLYEAEYRVRVRSGGWRWVISRGRAVVRGADGRALHLVGVVIDIDARKRAELALRESEARLEAALWGTGIGLWDERVGDSFRWFDDWCATMDFERSDGRDAGRQWRAQMHPDDVGPYDAAIDAANTGRSDHYVVEYRMKTRTGAWRWLHERGKVTGRDAAGRAASYVGVCFDVDDRKKMEIALRKAEERYQIAVDAAQLPVWEHDVPADEFKGNVYWHRIRGFELTAEQASQRSETWLSDIHPEDTARMARLARETANWTGYYETEFRIKTRNGGYTWLLDRGRVVERGEGGEPRKLSGIALDIDSRKRMELALRDSEARLETAVWGSDLGLWDWNLETDAWMWLSDWPARFGIGTEPGTSRLQWLARVHPLDGTRYAAEQNALVDGAKNSAESDYRIRDAQGDWRWVNVRTRVIERSAAGGARRLVGACIDVDERRRAEQLLRMQAVILETMREAVALIDPDGQIEFTNPAFDRMFGYAAGTLNGMSVFALLRLRRHRDPRVSGVESALRRFSARTGKRDALFQRRDGSRFAGEAIAASIESSGEKRGLVVIQDVSERKALEREIIEIANRERRRLGSDLHDGLGQELTGISLMLRSLAKQRSGAAQAQAPAVDEIIGLVNHAIQTARTMAVGLSPITLAHGGLLAALEALCGWSRTNYPLDVRLRLMLRSALNVTEATATHLYLITQESINNAVKHGHARSIVITLGTNQNLIILTVADDGVGITSPLRSTGMGVKIMEYRAGMIGGAFQIKNRGKGGTRIRCVCPQVSTVTDP